ncbi:hypothetical protein ACFOYW_15665 [Gryllotalpicola reticulitermitis]|uniref:Cell division protein FtsL n=1 Tax=Gryllotalpicola reticulitermitis TaxID=1184153 RepID=A0ABV8Q8W0_9MICO
MSMNGNTAVIGNAALDETSAYENPWVSALPLPSREERRRGLLAPVETPVGRKHRPKLVYAGIAVGALVMIVVAQLGLSIGVSNGAYRLSALQQQQKQIARNYQASSEAVDKLSSPQNLAANATALGMVANGSPVYLRLSNGKVIGSPAAATGSAAKTSGTTVQPLVPNALLTDLPLVTSKGATPSQVATDAVTPKPASQQTGSKPVTGTPAANVDPEQHGPVAWTGPLPAPATH